MPIEQEYIFTSNPVFDYSPEQLLFLALDTASTDITGAADSFQTGITALAEKKAPGTFQQIGEWIAKAGNLASSLTKDLDLENLFLSVWEGPQNIGLLESWILDQKIDDKIRCLYLRLLNTLCKEDYYETGRFLALWQELGRKAEAGEDVGSLAWQLVQISRDIICRNMPPAFRVTLTLWKLCESRPGRLLVQDCQDAGIAGADSDTGLFK